MDAGACVGAKGWGYARGGGTFCLHVWESVVSAGWRVCVCGGVEEVLLFPSAGKQCPRRVFYGSCWTLISFVPHLSPAAAALSPAKACAPPSSSPHPSLKKKKKSHAPRALASPVSTTGLPNVPCGQVCNKSIKVQHAYENLKMNFKMYHKIALMDNFPPVFPNSCLIPLNPHVLFNSLDFHLCCCLQK